MAPAPLANRRMLLLVVALVCSTLACTLSWLEEEDTGSPVAPDGQTGLPTVRIVSPASGQRVPVNQAVEVTVETNEAATGLTLSVDGRSGTSIGLPDDRGGPVTAILPWQPGLTGNYTLEVVAFNSRHISAPASITVEVSGSVAAAPGASGDNLGTSCTGRILISNLIIRAGPGTAYDRQGFYNVNETVTVLGHTSTNPADSWYRVRRGDGNDVWAKENANWVQVDPACNLALPITSAP